MKSQRNTRPAQRPVTPSLRKLDAAKLFLRRREVQSPGMTEGRVVGFSYTGVPHTRTECCAATELSRWAQSEHPPYEFPHNTLAYSKT